MIPLSEKTFGIRYKSEAQFPLIFPRRPAPPPAGKAKSNPRADTWVRPYAYYYRLSR